jgi:ABC-type enterochelin transport system ATPase subunit
MIIERLKKEDLKLYKDLIDEAFDGSNSIDSYEKYDENSHVYQIIVAKDNNKIVIAVLHDLNLVHYFSDNVCLVDKGQIVDYGKSVEVFNRSNLKDVYKIDVAKFMLEVFEKWK